jgi:hypothetical protein
MADWVKDRGLVVLVGQIDAAAPGRSKASDGFIGDLAHQSGESDHNPERSADADAPGNPDQQVDAADITHDPAHGADMGVVTEAIRVSRDPRVKYVIFNRRIFSGTLEARRAGLPAYTWGPYTGSGDTHARHAHVSIEDVTHDQTQPWSIGIGDTMSLPPRQTQQLDAATKRDEARVTGINPYKATWTAAPDDNEDSFELRQLHKIDDIQRDVARLLTLVEALTTAIATPPAGGTPAGALTAGQLAASLRAQVDTLTTIHVAS